MSRISLLIATLIANILVQPAFAYQRTPTPDDIRAAIDYGRSRKGQDLVDLQSAYFRSFEEGGGRGLLVVYTPWLFVALQSRAAATEYREYTVDQALRALAGRPAALSLYVTVIERRDRFWVNSHAVLLQNGNILQPLRKTSRFVKVVSCSGGPPCDLQASMEFDFRDAALDPGQDAELRLSIASGYREFKIPLKFGEMR